MTFALRNTFVIDGQLKEVGCARLAQAYGEMTYALPPHSNGASTIVTTTDGGSFNPLEFGITNRRIGRWLFACRANHRTRDHTIALIRGAAGQ